MKAMMKPGWLLGLCLLMPWPAATIALADAPEPPSADADPFGGHEWELTPYLKGTAPQIRDNMNGEVERLIGKIKETQRAIREAKADAVNDEKAALEKTHKTPIYRQTAADKAKAEADMESARASGSSEDRMNASSRFNKARMALEKMDHDAVVNCQELSHDRHVVFDSEKDLKRYNESLDKATAWREELLDATRNGFMLKGPLVEGTKGTLPRITVEKVIDSDHLLVGFDLLTFDMAHPGKDKEGIKSFPATKDRVHILVSGVEAGAMKAGDKLSLDRVFVVEGTKPDEKSGTVYRVKPYPSDADKLFEMIVPLRESLDDPKAKTPKG